MGTRKNRWSRRPTAAGVSAETLAEAPHRVMVFLLGVAARPDVWRALETRGYSEAEHDRGAALLQRLLRLRAPTLMDPEVGVSADALLEWSRDGLTVLNAALTRFPDVRHRLLDGFDRSDPVTTFLSIRRLLDGLDALEAAGEATEALARVASSGLPPATRARMRAQLRLVMAPPTTDDASAEAEREALLTELRQFHEEWSVIARLVLSRPSDLEAIGVGRGGRRRSPT